MSLVTAKPSDQKINIGRSSGNFRNLHVRRHESELRLNAAENNLKRADELRKQKQKQLDKSSKSKQKKLTKYKKISEEIRKI